VPAGSPSQPSAGISDTLRSPQARHVFLIL
jgi:hypothetical protein